MNKHVIKNDTYKKNRIIHDFNIESPDTFYIELTQRCNNNCIHCAVNVPAEDKLALQKELSTAELKHLLSEAASFGCLSVVFTGGEPLLREDFQELYIYARHLGLKVKILTNATLITPALADYFVAISPLEDIEVTIYGMRKDSYELITRNKGSFEAALRGINLLKEKKIPFKIRCAIFSLNKEEKKQFESWIASFLCVNKGLSYVLFLYLHCLKDADRNTMIRKLRVNPEEGINILFGSKSKQYLEKIKTIWLKTLHTQGDRLFDCRAGRGIIALNAEGFLQPCLMLRHPATMYNLRKGSLRDAMRNFFPKIIQMKAHSREYMTMCAQCLLKSRCQQCPATSWLEYGKLDMPVEYFCRVTHAQGKLLGIIKDNEKAWEKPANLYAHSLKRT